MPDHAIKRPEILTGLLKMPRSRRDDTGRGSFEYVDSDGLLETAFIGDHHLFEAASHFRRQNRLRRVAVEAHVRDHALGEHVEIRKAAQLAVTEDALARELGCGVT